MVRFLASLFAGLVLGLGLGLYLGWVQFPVEYIDSPATSLGPRYRDDYTVMIAGGYMADRDLTGAIQRLRVLGIDDVPAHVQAVAERYITNSRDVNDIRPLVALADGLGRLTSMMEPYREVRVPGQSS
jgi:hypothetical protein